MMSKRLCEANGLNHDNKFIDKRSDMARETQLKLYKHIKLPHDDGPDKKYEKFDGNTPDNSGDSGESLMSRKKIENNKRPTLAREKKLY